MNASIYNKWNEQKKLLEATWKEIFAHEREIWLVKLWQNIWHEQHWKENYLRPVLIFKKMRWVYLIIPLTTKWKNDLTLFQIQLHTFVRKKPSFLVLNQCRVLDSKRFVKKMWWISKDEFQEIKKIFLASLA